MLQIPQKALVLCLAGLLALESQAQQNRSQDVSLIDVSSISEDNQDQLPQQFSSSSRQGQMLPGEMDLADVLPSSEEDAPPPFGANLFAGGYETERFDGLTEDYLIAPGDKIAISLWGGVNANETLTVDNQGNLFIPNIGPVKLEGVSASSVNSVVTESIRSVYRSNVSIYVNLLSATPVSVYLSGSVYRPGQYAGLANDSILYYLKRAGGIDSDRGSYRKIKVIRGESVVEEFDLYDFMLSGTLPSFQFRDGDVIFVERQSAVVSVRGSVRNPFRFELKSDETTGDALSRFALPRNKTSHVAVIGDRHTGPFSTYVTLQEFSDFVLKDGDEILFNDDLRADVLDIEIQGSYLGPSYYAVSKGTRLHDLLSLIAVDESLSMVESVYIERESVAAAQKELIEESLNRLERGAFTSPVSSSGEGSIRAQEAGMLLQFTERARTIEPKGRVVIADNGKVSNILLEAGDRIVIPARTDLITIAGEVVMPQSMVFNENADVEDYIAWAGGYGERGNPNQILVVKPNGKYENADSTTIEAGDKIIVMPKVNHYVMQSVKDITQVIYQIAVATDVVLGN